MENPGTKQQLTCLVVGSIETGTVLLRGEAGRGAGQGNEFIDQYGMKAFRTGVYIKVLGGKGGADCFYIT